MSAPLYEHLLAYSKQNRISFAMPGHKNGRGLKKDLLSLDVTELSATENLIHPGEYVLKHKSFVNLYGSDKSYILTGGSTICNSVYDMCRRKARRHTASAGDCHMSVINTCALLGIN